MKQVIQNIRNGKLTVNTIPAPAVVAGEVLIANQSSLVSAGTEKMVMDLAKKSLLGKARERPDQVRRVLEKIRNEGLMNTIQQVRRKLDEPMTMGYSSAGVVVACGANVQHFKSGDRVASNGPHAEVVSVPVNLCARVPDNVTFDHASFAVLGSIALQGIRLSQCHLGESVFVVGLGLVGQLTVALAAAAGFRVIGTDLDASRCELATKMGATLAEPGLKASTVQKLTGGLGADAVLITASTKSNAPIEIAADCVRKKGRVVLVGVVGLELDRRPFYFKEAEFVVSCSYGPGRYDPSYEENGHDYPAAYVRWTEQRNIQAVLELLGSGRLDLEPLISHRFGIDEAPDAYELINTGSEPFLGVVLQYPKVEVTSLQKPERRVVFKSRSPGADKVRIGVLGAGNFARMVMLPAIRKCPEFQQAVICTSKGVTGTNEALTSDFERSTTDEDDVFLDDSINTVFSLTRHDQHTGHVIRAIRQRKNIFVEKPLCLNSDELGLIERTVLEAGDECPLIMTGFNRRFAPATSMLRDFFRVVNEPLTVAIRFNAGSLPRDHWTQDESIGGGRIIGEACHAIDLATYLTGSVPVRVFAESVGIYEPGSVSDDRCFITMRHANGSVSSVGYLSGGDKAFAKERIEVFGGERVGVIDDFARVQLSQGGRLRTETMTQDKGHDAEIAALARTITTQGQAPIPWDEIQAVSAAAIGAVLSLREGVPVPLATVNTASKSGHEGDK